MLFLRVQGFKHGPKIDLKRDADFMIIFDSLLNGFGILKSDRFLDAFGRAHDDLGTFKWIVLEILDTPIQGSVVRRIFRSRFDGIFLPGTWNRWNMHPLDARQRLSDF